MRAEIENDWSAACGPMRGLTGSRVPTSRMKLFTLFVTVNYLYACTIVYVRFEGDTKYSLDKPIQAANCSYTETVKALNKAKHDPGLHHAIFRLSRTTVLVTDTQKPEPKEGAEAIWKQVEGDVLQALNDKFEEKFKYLGPLPTLDKAKKVGLINHDSKTCYANSLIQCLYHVPHFYYRLGTATKKLDLGEDTVPGALWTIFKDMAAGNVPVEDKMTDLITVMNEYLSAAGLLREGDRFYQNDSAEILTELIEHLNEVLVFGSRPALMPNVGLFDDLFGITYHETRKNIDGHVTMDQLITQNMIKVVADPAIIEKQTSKDQVELRTRLEVFEQLGQTEGGLSPEEGKAYAELKGTLDDLEELDLQGLIISTAAIGESRNTQGIVMEEQQSTIIKLPPYLFINFSRSGHEYRLDNPIGFPLKYIDPPKQYNNNLGT